jgi:hypothetical protein
MALFDDDITPACQINLEWIGGADGGSTDPSCRAMILEFIAYLNPKEYLTTAEKLVNGFSGIYKKEFEELSSEEFVNFTRAKLSRNYEFEGQEAISLIFNHEINYQRSDFHKDFFPYFFSYRLSKLSFVRLKDFLVYNLERNFKNNLDELTFFVKDVAFRQFNSLVDKDKMDASLNCLEVLRNELLPNVASPSAREIQWSKVQVTYRTSDGQPAREETPGLAAKAASTGKKREYTQRQIALGIYYKQIAKTFPWWSERSKQTEMKTLTDQYGLQSSNKFQKAYNNFAIAKDSDQNRLLFLGKGKDAAKVASFLDDDEQATSILNQELIKARIDQDR